MNKPHKHAEVIKAWADGAKIQYRENGRTEWFDVKPKETPLWIVDREYRVKPELKDPGKVCREAWYTAMYGCTPFSNKEAQVAQWTAAAKAVIEAYKAGELKDI